MTDLLLALLLIATMTIVMMFVVSLGSRLIIWVDNVVDDFLCWIHQRFDRD